MLVRGLPTFKLKGGRTANPALFGTGSTILQEMSGVETTGDVGDILGDGSVLGRLPDSVTRGLVHRYTFADADVDTVVRDIVGSNHLNFINAAPFTHPYTVTGPGGLSEALRFGKDAGQVSVYDALWWTTPPIPDTGWTGSVTFWLRPDQLSTANNDGDPRYLCLGTSTDLVVASTPDNGLLNVRYGPSGVFEHLGTDLILDAYQFISFTFDGAALKVYLNAVDITNLATRSDVTTAGQYSVMGRTILDGTDVLRQCVGRMADLRFYDSILTPTEMLELYTSIPAVLLSGVSGLGHTGTLFEGVATPRGLTGYWPLDAAHCSFSPSGQVMPLDIVGNNFGADAKSPGAAGGPPDDTGGLFYSFDKTAATYLTLNSDPINGMTADNVTATYLVWAYHNSYEGSESPGGAPRICAFNDIVFYMEDGTNAPAGTIGCERGNVGSSGKRTSSSVITLNNWTFLAVTMNGSTFNSIIYVDGVAVPISADDLGYSIPPPGVWGVGCRENGFRVMDGKLAHLMVCAGTVLTADEIAEVYNSFLP